MPALFFLNERLHVGCEIFHGETSATEAAAFITELAETFTIRECVFDPWQARCSPRRSNSAASRPSPTRSTTHGLHRPGPEPIDAVFALAICLDRAEHEEEPVELLGWV